MKPVSMVTERRDEGMYYVVKVADAVVWSRYVLFGKTKATRAGGYAFTQAAREQEAKCRELAGKEGKPAWTTPQPPVT